MAKFEGMMNRAPEATKKDTGGDPLSTAIAAAKAGEFQRARVILTQLVEEDERNAQAWLWLSGVVDNLAEVQICLENYLTLEPDRPMIRERLAWLVKQNAAQMPPSPEPGTQTNAEGRVEPPQEPWPAARINPEFSPDAYPPSELTSSLLEKLVILEPGNVAARREWLKRTGQTAREDAGTPPALAGQIENLEVRRGFLCPQCGGKMRFNPNILEVQCTYCGHIEEVKKEPIQMADEALDLTSAGLRMRSADGKERILRCKQCGAVTLFPPAAISVTCPYCDGSFFAAVPEDAQLYWPQAIIPMQIEANEAHRFALKWLNSGFFYSKNLKESDLKRFIPLYVPVWLINAAISFDDPRGSSLLGRRDFLYTDWVVPGTRSRPAQHIPDLKPFRWEELVQFQPGFLASWPASLYDVPISTASRRACAEMRSEACRQFPAGAGKQASFFCQSYNLVLFPIWICNYAYRGKDFHLVVNGQTGKTAGDRPFNWTRVALATAAAGGILVLLVAGLMRILETVLQQMNLTVSAISASMGSAWALLVPVLAMLVLLVILILRS